MGEFTKYPKSVDSGKADKVVGALPGNLAELDLTGNLMDSGVSVSTNPAETSSEHVMTAQATQEAIANKISSAKSYRGGWDASGSAFPTTGGSGSSGAIVKGDQWDITVAGTLGSEAVSKGDTITAIADAPGQTADNWLISADKDYLHDLEDVQLVGPSEGQALTYNGSKWVNSSITKTEIGLGDVQNVDQTNASNLVSGTVNSARLPAFNGDVTSTAGTSTLHLGDVVTAGQSAKVSYDSKGRVTGGSSLLASDIPSLTISKISDITTASVASSGRLTTPRNINGVAFDGSVDITIPAAISDVGTPGTYTAVTTNSKGQVTAGDQLTTFQQDIINWTGSTTIANNAYLNLFSLAGIAIQAGGTLGLTLGGGVIKFPAKTRPSQVIFSTRITGTMSGGATTDPKEWRIQTRRPDGTTLVGSAGDVKISGNDINNRDAALISYTLGITDPFTLDGIQVGLLNGNNGLTITLTAVSVRVQRIINPE